jgi:hypothetical protein
MKIAESIMTEAFNYSPTDVACASLQCGCVLAAMRVHEIKSVRACRFDTQNRIVSIHGSAA